MLDWGLPPTRPGVAVDLRSLDRVIDYPARDMTVTVEAGMTIDSLQQLLKTEGQQLPVDVPLLERATIGGAIATNANGPRRFGYGTLRDYVIGISVVNDQGEEVKGGGRVVKNVAGYDLMKLYTGSFGTLGIISQLTLKVKPLPEAVAAVVASCPPDSLEPTLNRFLASTKTRPTVVSIANEYAAPFLNMQPMPCQLLIGFEEKSATVDWQVRQLNQEIPDGIGKSASEFHGNLATLLFHKWADFPLAHSAGLTFKANMLPAMTTRFFRQADGLIPRPALVAHVGSGIVYGHWPRETTVEDAKKLLDILGRAAAEASGNLVVMRCPPAWKAVLPVWGRSTPDRVLMRAVKDKLDPGRLFNPGRFVDEI